MLAPASPSWGGSAAVDERGRRGRHRLAAAGRAAPREPGHPDREVPRRQGRADRVRPRGEPAAAAVARPLHGRASRGRVVVDGFTESGPARAAGFRRATGSSASTAWTSPRRRSSTSSCGGAQAGDLIEVAVRRDDRVQVITVRSIDRHHLYPHAPPLGYDSSLMKGAADTYQGRGLIADPIHQYILYTRPGGIPGRGDRAGPDRHRRGCSACAACPSCSRRAGCSRPPSTAASSTRSGAMHLAGRLRPAALSVAARRSSPTRRRPR